MSRDERRWFPARQRRPLRRVRSVAAGALTLVSLATTVLVACNAIIDDHYLFLVDAADGSPTSAGHGSDVTPSGAGDTSPATTDTGPVGEPDAGGGAAPDADPDLLAYYTFDEDGGPLAHDRTGHGNDLVLSSGASVGGEGHAGAGGLQFSGLASVASCASLSDGNFPQTGTLSFWAYFPTPDGSSVIRRLFDDYDETRTHLFVRYSAGAMDASTYEADFTEQVGKGYTFFERPTVPLNVWTHIVLVWDATADGGTAQFYEDGVLPPRADDSFPPGALDQKFNLFNGWAGSVDDVYVWSRAFTAVEAVEIP